MDASGADATLSVLTSNRDSKGKEVRMCLITGEEPVTTGSPVLPSASTDSRVV